MMIVLKSSSSSSEIFMVSSKLEFFVVSRWFELPPANFEAGGCSIVFGSKRWSTSVAVLTFIFTTCAILETAFASSTVFATGTEDVGTGVSNVVFWGESLLEKVSCYAFVVSRDQGIVA